MNVAEVAKAARVSLATVSRVINNPASVSPEKVALVREAMAGLKYVPPSPGVRRGPKLGPRLRKRSAARIGFWCIGTPEEKVRMLFSSQLEALHLALADLGMEVKLLFSSPDEVPPELLDGTLAGFLVQGLEPSDASRRKIAKIPRVWLMTRRSEDYAGDYVEPDNIVNGRLAADWLAAQKAQRWVYLTTEPDYPAYAQRGAAFRMRALELGFQIESITGAGVTGTHQSGASLRDSDMVELVKRFRALSPAADGVYIPGDSPCGPFFRELRRQGGDPAALRTVIGHYNPQVYESLDPQPVAIDINLRAIVDHAVRQLVDRIVNPGRQPLPVGLRVAPFLRT